MSAAVWRGQGDIGFIFLVAIKYHDWSCVPSLLLLLLLLLLLRL